MRSDGLDQAHTVGGRLRHRLLQQHMIAALQRRNSRFDVHLVLRQVEQRRRKLRAIRACHDFEAQLVADIEALRKLAPAYAGSARPPRRCAPDRGAPRHRVRKHRARGIPAPTTTISSGAVIVLRVNRDHDLLQPSHAVAKPTRAVARQPEPAS